MINEIDYYCDFSFFFIECELEFYTQITWKCCVSTIVMQKDTVVRVNESLCDVRVLDPRHVQDQQ